MSGFTWSGDAFALRVAATLLHFVWQGLVLALIAGSLSGLLHTASARARYVVNLGLLLAMVACLPVTFSVLNRVPVGLARSNVEASAHGEFLAAAGAPFVGDTADSTVATPQFVGPAATADSSPNLSLSETNSQLDLSRVSQHTAASEILHNGILHNSDFSRTLNSLAPFITWAYFVGVVVMTVRLVVGLRGGQSLRRHSLLVEDAGLLDMAREQAAKIGLSFVPAIAFCERISVPIVIGIVRPMILLPATLISGLSPDQLQALVTHELSHIRRYDLLVNLLQRIVEAVLFFHPAVWFVSRRISMERENAADDAVLAAGWPAVRYADALVRMAELSSALRSPGLAVQVTALAAAGSSSSEFKRRVIRLLDGSSASPIRLSRIGIFAMTLVTASLLMTPVVVQLAADDESEPSATLATDDTEEVETAVKPDESPTAEKKPEGADEPAGPPRIIDGFVTGPGGAIAGAKATVTLSIVDEEAGNGFGLSIGKVVRTLEYTTDENGRYKIAIPAALAANPQVRVSVKLEHPKYLGRQMGPLLVTDFDEGRIGNDQPRWLSRQMDREAIRQSRLRKAHHLTGRILLPNGTPAVGAKVQTATRYQAYSWKFHSPDDYGTSDRTVTDDQGQFSIVIDERASFTAMMRGQAPLIIDDLAKRIQIANGDGQNDFRLPSANRIMGQLLTAEGRPVPRAIVTARRDVKWSENDMPLSFSISCAADELGYYELPPLPSGQYKLSVGAQLDAESRPDVYNEFMSSFRTTDKPDFGTQPLDLVFVPMTTTLGPFVPVTTLDLQAVPMVTLKVNVEFPDGAPDPNRHSDVGISGTINGREWNGQYVKADKNGIAILRAPKGLEWAFIKTGLARHRCSADAEVEIGDAIHFKRLDEDVAGVTVIKPELAKLKVMITELRDATLGSAKSQGRISISANYARKGFREQSSDRQSIGLTGARTIHSGQTEYHGTSLPNEPIVLTVTVTKDGDRRTIHEEQLTLAPGEDRLREITIGSEKAVTSKAKLESAIDRASGFLLARQRADGSWAANNDDKGYTDGTTALVALALLDDGDLLGEAVENATQYLLKASPDMTKEVAVQTIFLRRLGKPGAAICRRNLKWLVDAQIKQGPNAGGWGYQGNSVGGYADGANSAYAILALATVAARNPAGQDKIPAEVWQRSLDWLLRTQHEDGSWGYTARGSKTSDTMTACGVTGLKALRSQLKATPQIEEAIEKGERWLSTNWKVGEDRSSSAWPMFHLDWMCRALHDRQKLGERDWYPEVVETVLASQQRDGSFSLSSNTSPIISTAFALDILRNRPMKQVD